MHTINVIMGVIAFLTFLYFIDEKLIINVDANKLIVKTKNGIEYFLYWRALSNNKEETTSIRLYFKKIIYILIGLFFALSIIYGLLGNIILYPSVLILLLIILFVFVEFSLEYTTSIRKYFELIKSVILLYNSILVIIFILETSGIIHQNTFNQIGGNIFPGYSSLLSSIFTLITMMIFLSIAITICLLATWIYYAIIPALLFSILYGSSYVSKIILNNFTVNNRKMIRRIIFWIYIISTGWTFIIPVLIKS